MRIFKSFGVICKLIYLEMFLSKKETEIFNYANRIFSSNTSSDLLVVLNESTSIEKTQEKLWAVQSDVSQILLKNHLSNLKLLIKKQTDGVKDEKDLKIISEKGEKFYEEFYLEKGQIESSRELAQNIGRIALRFLTIYAFDASQGAPQTKEALNVYAQELLENLKKFAQQPKIKRGYLSLSNDLEIFPIISFGFSMVAKCCKVLSFENSSKSQLYLKMMDELNRDFEVFSRRTIKELNETIPLSVQNGTQGVKSNSLTMFTNWVNEFRKQSTFEKALINFASKDDEALQRSIDDAYFALGETALQKKIMEKSLTDGYVNAEFRQKVIPMLNQSKIAYSKMIKPIMN